MEKIKVKYNNVEYYIDKYIERYIVMLDTCDVQLTSRYDGYPDLCAVYKKTEKERVNKENLRLSECEFSHLTKDNFGYRINVDFELIK